MIHDIFYSKDRKGDAEQVVLVHIEDWPSKIVLLEGNKVLGKPGEHDTVILAEYGLPAEFPIEVETLPKKMILIEESELRIVVICVH
jgi:ribonuclease R